MLPITAGQEFHTAGQQAPVFKYPGLFLALAGSLMLGLQNVDHSLIMNYDLTARSGVLR